MMDNFSIYYKGPYYIQSEDNRFLTINSNSKLIGLTPLVAFATKFKINRADISGRAASPRPDGTTEYICPSIDDDIKFRDAIVNIEVVPKKGEERTYLSSTLYANVTNTRDQNILWRLFNPIPTQRPFGYGISPYVCIQSLIKISPKPLECTGTTPLAKAIREELMGEYAGDLLSTDERDKCTDPTEPYFHSLALVSSDFADSVLRFRLVPVGSPTC